MAAQLADDEDESGSAGVAYVEQGALAVTVALADGEGAARFSVFNGSPRTQTIRFAFTGGIETNATVDPAESNIPAGQVRQFTLHVTTMESLQGGLVALSTDGTLARRSVSVTMTGEVVPLVAVPKKLTLAGQLSTVRSDPLDLGAPGAASMLGRIFNAEGDGAEVRRTVDNRLELTELGEPGEYSGTVDVTPGEDGGEIELTANVRRQWWLAALLLATGLALAFGLEFWIARARPRRLVNLRVDRLRDEVERGQEKGDVRLGTGSWRVPKIWSKEKEEDASLVGRETRRIKDGILNAFTDAARARWGPDGEELEQLEKAVRSYEGLVNRSLELADAVKRLEREVADVDPQMRRSSIGRAVDTALDGRLLGDSKALETAATSVDAIRAVAGGLLALNAAYEDLLADPPKGKKRAIAAQRRTMLLSVASEDDLKDARETFRGLLAPPPPGDRADVRELLSTVMAAPASARAAAHGMDATPRDDVPSARGVVLGSTTGFFKRQAFMDAIFAFGSGVVVLGSGLATVYFADATWGGPEDYLFALVWGSTVQAALNLGRRLLPGAAGKSGGE